MYASGKSKISDFHLLRSLYARKIVPFVVQCQFIFFVRSFLLVNLFVRKIYFSKKATHWLKIVLMTSITLLLKLPKNKAKKYNRRTSFQRVQVPTEMPCGSCLNRYLILICCLISRVYLCFFAGCKSVLFMYYFFFTNSAVLKCVTVWCPRNEFLHKFLGYEPFCFENLLNFLALQRFSAYNIKLAMLKASFLQEFKVRIFTDVCAKLFNQ